MSPEVSLKRLFCLITESHRVFAASGKMKLLNILMHLRKVCNHPFLFDDDFDSFYKKYKNNQIEVDEPEEKPVQVKAAEETNGSGKKKRKRRGQVEEIAGECAWCTQLCHCLTRV